MKVAVSFEIARHLMLQDETYHLSDSSDSCYGINKKYWDDEVEGVMVLKFQEHPGWWITNNPSEWFIPDCCVKDKDEDNSRGE